MIFTTGKFVAMRPGALTSIALLGLLFSQWASGRNFDYSVCPKANENFLAASFRYTCLPSAYTSDTVLVYIPGTDGDGRGAADNPALLRMATACHANLLGCYYRGEGLSYDDPSKGSGRALQEALAYFADKSGRDQSKRFRLLLVGFSEGGMFVFNYVCLYPEQVQAFAALRAIFPRFKPQATSFEVPGLLAAGGADEPGRVRAIASAFEEAEGHDSKWAFLWERGSGHETGRSLDLTSLLFESTQRQISSPVFWDTMAKSPFDPSFDQSNRCWFPNAKVADRWKSLHQPETLENLTILPDPPRLQNFIRVQGTPEVYRCENGGRQFGSMRIASQGRDTTISQIRVIGDGFTIDWAGITGLPAELKVCFAPKGMSWGETRATVIIGGGQNGDSIRTTLFGMVTGILTPIPSTLYLGVVAPGEEVEKTIHLKSSEPVVHFSNIRVPKGITAFVDQARKNGDLTLQVRWIGGSRLGSMQGQIELNIDSPEKGTLRVPVCGFVAQTSS